MLRCPPLELLYVDRACCGNSSLHKLFAGWPNIHIRLDIYHFMRRFTTGCTTDSHVLYTRFMSQLARCIFVWDESDLKNLKEAKQAELEQSHMRPTEAAVLHHITKRELMLHCRRTVRGTEEMEGLLQTLMEVYDGEGGRDTLGVPLVNSAKMAEIWKEQQKHISCLQDPPGFQLYTQTGTVKKSGHVLPTYCCARGSSSLESFHRHMNRFIPGTAQLTFLIISSFLNIYFDAGNHIPCDLIFFLENLAGETFFQAYLLDGLSKWNKDRTMVVKGKDGPLWYSSFLAHATNELAQKVFGRKLLECTAPQKYTGMDASRILSE